MPALFLLLVPGLAAAAPYELGQGYPLPFLGLTAGGYASLQISELDNQKAEATVQDLSLFLHADPSADWHFFAEIEVSNPLTLRDDRLRSSDIDLDFERLYVDHNLSARDTLRIGRFLTPVGRWNTIHADPLVWSASRPLSTAAAFARNVSGLQLYGSRPFGDGSIDYQVYIDDSDEFNPGDGNEKTFMDSTLTPNPPSVFSRGFGAHLQYGSASFDDDWSIGLSTARFRLRDLPGNRNLAGADFHYGHGDMELTGEAVYRSDDSHAGSSEYGWFLQWVAPIRSGFYGVVTHERYKAELFHDPVDTTSLGITYRPVPPVAIKLEHRESSGEERLAPSGWLFSAAIMF